MNLRLWLKNNKIYFEIFSYIFLGLASIIVAILSWNTSHKQLEILQLEHLPVINIQRDYKTPFEMILVENVGYHLFEPKVDINSYFEIQRTNYNSSDKKTYFYRIDDYYNFVINTDNTVGRVSTIYSTEYYEDEKKRIFKEFISLDNWLDYEIDLKSILRVDFKDENKSRYSKYYTVNDFSIIEIDKEKYYRIYDKLNDTYIQGMSKSIKDITALELIKIID